MKPSTLNKLNDEILDQIISYHIEYFRNGISSKLGKEYLNYFYSRINKSKKCILLVYLRKKRVVGFVAGTLSSSDFYDFGHKRKILWNILKHFIKGEVSLEDINRLIKKERKFSMVKIEPELLSIVVDPNNRKKGMGKVLVKSLCKFFIAKNKSIWKVSTDDLLGYKFYKKLKLKQIFEFSLGNVKSSIFVGKSK